MGINGNKRVNEYVDNICSQIKNTKVHQEIRDEVLSHIEESYENYLAEGLSEAEAAEKAISGMGDSTLIGRQLNKVHKEAPEFSVLILTLVFSGIGLLSLYFIDMNYNNGSFFMKSMVGLIIGITVAVLLYFIDYRKIQHYSKYIYLAALIVLAFCVFRSNVSKAGAWIRFGSLSINFIDMSPLLFTVALSGMLIDWNWRETRKFILGLILLILPLSLFLQVRNLPSAAFYCAAVLVILFISGINFRYILILIASGTAFTVYASYNEAYLFARLTVFLHPAKDITGEGYMYLQLNKLINSAGLWGHGFANSSINLADIHTDFIFTYIIYTLGWIFGIVVSMLIVLFIVRLSRIAFVIKDNYGKMLIGGIAAVFSMEFIWNILMNLGLAPITAISLPFMSYGNSKFVLNLAAIGLISGIYKRKNSKVALVSAK